jgi:iron complex outermembrane receptor protein
MTQLKTHRLASLALVAGTAVSLAAHAQDAAPQPGAPEGNDVAELSLEELMQVDVTSVAGVAKPLMQTPAAVFVITPQDIQETGHLSIAEALRIVPGMDVARVSSNTWAVSARGFNARFSNKLLVLVDGRALYNDLFSGVFWDTADIVMQDLDRIEVVRGPGATLWGANAVNGVINVVSKSSKDTQGWLLTGGMGTEEQGFGTARYGGKISDDSYFRVYTKYFNRDSGQDVTGGNAADDWRQGRAGARLDLGVRGDTKVTISGDVYGGDSGENIGTPALTPPYQQLIRGDTHVEGGNLLGKLEHSISEVSGIEVKAYVDYDMRDNAVLDEHRRTLDFDARHFFQLGERHSIIWGLGYRNRADSVKGSAVVSFTPDERSEDMFSGFVQDTISIVKDKVNLMLGSKFEHNGYSEWEIQPSARVEWNVAESHTLWAGISRAVRTPTRVGQDLDFLIGVIPPPLAPDVVPVRLRGNPEIEGEDLLAYELGYRVRPSERVSIDIATYYNRYEDLITQSPDPLNPADYIQANDGSSDSVGLEVAANWQVTSKWRLGGAYTLQCIEIMGRSDEDQDSAPRNQFNIRSSLDLCDSVKFNTVLYYYDNVRDGDVPAYTRLDVGLTYIPRPNVELSIWGQNLLDEHHLEMVDTYFARPSMEIDRGIYGMLTLRF